MLSIHHPRPREAEAEGPARAGEATGPDGAHLATKVSQQIGDIYSLSGNGHPVPNFRA